jgi:hypothetical protein
VTKSGNASEASFAKQLQSLETTYTSRMKSCEDDRAVSARAREVEKEQLSRDWQRQEAQLLTERDEQHKLAESRARDLDRCRADLVPQNRSGGTDHSGIGETIETPPSVGETPMPGSGVPSKRHAPPAPEPSPFGPAPFEGTLNVAHPSSDNPYASPSPAAANW